MRRKRVIRDLFTDTDWAPLRRPYRKLARLVDGGCGTFHFECKRCGWDSGWLELCLSVTAAKRGMPCPECNSTSVPAGAGY